MKEYTAGEAAKLLGGIARQRIQQFRQQGRLEGRETSIGWFYSARSVAALAAALRRDPRSRLHKGAPR